MLTTLHRLGSEGNVIGPGQVGVFHAAGGQTIVSEHFYDGAADGTPTLNLLELQFDLSGWPTFSSAVGASKDI